MLEIPEALWKQNEERVSLRADFVQKNTMGRTSPLV